MKRFIRPLTFLTTVLFLLLLNSRGAHAAWVWIEGEKPAEQSMNRHPWYADVKRDLLSGGDFISNFNDNKPGEATYQFQAPEAGEYTFWLHGNPVKSRLSYALNRAALSEIDLSGEHLGQTNIASDGKPDLRFVAWIQVGTVALNKGANEIRFRMDGNLSNHGLIDCFVFANEPFEPQGIAKPDEVAQVRRKMMQANQGWFSFRSARGQVRWRQRNRPAGS